MRNGKIPLGSLTVVFVAVALVVAQFSFGTDVKETQAAIEENIASAGLPESVDADVSALNINASPVVIASIAATNEDGLEAAADIARTEIVPEILGLEGVASADLTGGLEQQVLVTLDPDKLAETGITVAQISGVLQANGTVAPEPMMDARHVADAVRHIAALPLSANVLNMTVMASAMPFVGRG